MKIQRDGRKFIFFIGPEEKMVISFEAEGRAFGTWSKGESFAAMNNFDNFGHGPGLERAFSAAEVGEAFEYFMAQKRAWDQAIQAEKEQRERDQAAERREKRRAKRERAKHLKGGLGSECGFSQPLFK